MAATTRRRQTLAVLVLALAPALAWAAPATAESKEKETAPAEKVRQQLDQTVTLEVTDQPLSAALNQLREQTKINFVVDKFTMQQLGLDPQQIVVTSALQDVKARTALRTLLAPYNLGYAIVGDTVLVSTDDAAMTRQLKQRVSIDVEKLDLAAALKKLSKETAANVLPDSRVPGKLAKTEVTLEMDDVPLETAVRLIAETAGLKPVRIGNVLMVTTKAIANEIRSDPDMNDANNNPQPNQQKMQLWQLQQMQQMNQAIWLNGINGNIQLGGMGIGINPINGLPIQPGQAGNLPVPPLEKPADKDADPPAEDDKPAPPERKPVPPRESR
jgi:type II secretory pathway component GspD/PulD (secretin)